MAEIWDSVIIGGGPAGLSAAIYLARDEKKILILEKKLAGGMMSATVKVDNYPGFAPGTTGFEIGQAMLKQAQELGAEIDYKNVSDFRKNGQNWQVILDNQSMIETKTILIATGTNYRHLNIPGEAEMIGRGVHFCATCDGPFYKDKTIAVIGGGNSAIEEATFLTKFAKKIYLLVRDGITATESLVREMKPFVESGQIEIVKKASTQEIIHDGQKVSAIKYQQDNQEKELSVDGIFVFVGLIANTDFVKTTKLDLDDYGFIKINQNNMTSQAGIFACGDITSNAVRQIATASADGVKSALKISDYLK